MKKRFFLVAIATILALSMIACSTPAEQSTPSNTESKAPQTVSTVPDGDWRTPYEEPLTLTIATRDEPSMEYPEGEDITNNWWTQAYKEKFNVDVVTDWVSDEYDTKINLAITSGDLPDVFRINQGHQLRQLIEADLIWDLTDVFDTYASDLVKEFAEYDPDTFASGTYDGKLYGIPHMHWGWVTQPYYLWLRDDWMVEQNFSAPETMDDLEHMMETFRSEYGGYGMAVDKSLTQLYALAPAWGAYPQIWVDNNGTLEAGALQPEMKDALATFAQWYKEGHIDPSFSSYDMNAMNTDVISGKTGVQTYQQWWGYNPGADVVANLGAESLFQAYEIPKATADVKYPLNFDNNGYTVVNKNFEHPEAAVKLLNLYPEVYYGENDTDEYEIPNSIDGYAHIAGPFRMVCPYIEEDNYNAASKALAEGNEDSLVSPTHWGKYNGSKRWIDNQDPSGLGDFMQVGNGDHAAFKIGQDILEEDRYIQTKIWGTDPEIMGQYGSTLDDLLLEGFTKIIIGAEDIDYFDTLVEHWKSAGGNAVTDAVNEMYG